MSLDLEVRGDPGACRDAAHRLVSIAATTQAAGDGLARASGIADADFGGLSGDAFRSHARTLAETADDTAQRCRRLARGLSELALDLEDVRRTMARARGVAEPWLVVADRRIWPPGTGDETFPKAARAAWQVATDVVDLARQVEERAQRDWRDCLWQVAEAVPLMPHDPVRGPHLAPEDPATPSDHSPGPAQHQPDHTPPTQQAAPTQQPAAPHPGHPATSPATAASTSPAATAASTLGASATTPSPTGAAQTGGTWAVGSLPDMGVGHVHDPEVGGPTLSPPVCDTPIQIEDADEQH